MRVFSFLFWMSDSSVTFSSHFSKADLIFYTLFFFCCCFKLDSLDLFHFELLINALFIDIQFILLFLCSRHLIWFQTYFISHFVLLLHCQIGFLSCFFGICEKKKWLVRFLLPHTRTLLFTLKFFFITDLFQYEFFPLWLRICHFYKPKLLNYAHKYFTL